MPELRRQQQELQEFAEALCRLHLQILLHACTDDTHCSLDTLDLFVQRFASSTGTPVAEPLKVALVQRGVTDTDAMNHLVMHATRLNTYASVCEEVRNIMLTRATLMNDIGALDKEKGKEKGKDKKGDEVKGKGKGKQGAGSPRGKRMRTQTRMFSASTAGREGAQKT